MSYSSNELHGITPKPFLRISMEGAVRLLCTIDSYLLARELNLYISGSFSLQLQLSLSHNNRKPMTTCLFFSAVPRAFLLFPDTQTLNGVKGKRGGGSEPLSFFPRAWQSRGRGSGQGPCILTWKQGGMENCGWEKCRWELPHHLRQHIHLARW